MSSLKIELFDLNNAPLYPSGRIDGIEEFTVTYKEDDDNGTITSSYSSELTFYDDGYQLIYSQLINNPIGFSQKIKVNIYDECCGKLVYTGFIKGDSIDWCDTECSVSTNLIFEDESTSCIANTLIWDNKNGFTNKSYNRIDYCVENRPAFIHSLILIIGGFLALLANFILYIVYGIIWVIWLVVSAICSIVSVFSNVDCSGPGQIASDWIGDAIEEINEALWPCKNYHVAPFLRDYIINACDICGLQFQSSILNDPAGSVGSIYYNTVLLSMQVKEGRGYYSTNNTMIIDNLPVETLETLFRDYLNPLFNGKWRVVGNKFIFERKDFFDVNDQWIDSDQLLLNGKIVDNKICWNWQDKERYAYGRFEYQMDAMEYVGNDAKNQYNDIVDWNTPNPSSSQKGEFVRSIEISPTRCLKDQFGSFLNSPILSGGANPASIQNQLVVAQHTAFNYKIFIYSGDNLKPVKGYNGEYDDTFTGINIGVDVNERINYPYWFLEGQQGVYGAQNNLYSLFHYIDNPRLPGTVQYDFNFTFEFECGQYDDFSFNKYVKLTRGSTNLIGKVKEISVDFRNRTIQVKGVA